MIKTETDRKSAAERRSAMDNFEPKKLALLRIWQILWEHSDDTHPLTQEEIAHHLQKDYGIIIERKAIGRNLSLLKEAGAEICSSREGSFLSCRDFEDSELQLLIDGVLSSKHITAKQSADLIDRLCKLSNKYFRSHVKNICSVGDWSKTDNPALFYNIELIDTAIEKKRRIGYDYNKFGTDKKLHKSSHQEVTPYQMLLHNQRYYLMAYCEYWGHIVFHRLDRMTNMCLIEEKATPLSKVPGYETGLNYKKLASSMPYMYSDKQVRITFLADSTIVDQIVDWFGKDVRFAKCADEGKVEASVTASPQAMQHWAMQYIDHVEIISPPNLREAILQSLKSALKKYK